MNEWVRGWDGILFCASDSAHWPVCVCGCVCALQNTYINTAVERNLSHTTAGKMPVSQREGNKHMNEIVVHLLYLVSRPVFYSESHNCPVIGTALLWTSRAVRITCSIMPPCNIVGWYVFLKKKAEKQPKSYRKQGQYLFCLEKSQLTIKIVFRRQEVDKRVGRKANYVHAVLFAIWQCISDCWVAIWILPFTKGSEFRNGIGVWRKV